MQDSDNRFNYAVAVVLSHEGGLSNNKADKGGMTNFGISANFVLENHICRTSIMAMDFVRFLTNDKAATLYKQYFWFKYNYNLLEDLQLATKIFDMAVNMGAHEAHTLLQRAINKMSYDQVLVDGVLGINTLHAANGLPETYLHEELRDMSKEFYISLVEITPSDKVFLEDWLKRAAW